MYAIRSYYDLRTGTRKGTLLDVLDQTITSMGGRMLRQWLRYPLRNPEAILERLDAVETARIHMAQAVEIRENLKSVYDLERLGSRIVMGHANGRVV